GRGDTRHRRGPGRGRRNLPPRQPGTRARRDALRPAGGRGVRAGTRHLRGVVGPARSRP
ncbi:MAG: hypothetical protein AVDCRST_MAG25-146, partial [uncultured Rubrobacteraceae bacterium]